MPPGECEESPAMSHDNTEFREWFAKWFVDHLSPVDRAPNLADSTDWIIQHMLAAGLTVSRQSWQEFNYSDGVPDQLPAELAADIPPAAVSLPPAPARLASATRKSSRKRLGSRRRGSAACWRWPGTRRRASRPSSDHRRRIDAGSRAK